MFATARKSTPGDGAAGIELAAPDPRIVSEVIRTLAWTVGLAGRRFGANFKAHTTGMSRGSAGGWRSFPFWRDFQGAYDGIVARERVRG